MYEIELEPCDKHGNSLFSYFTMIPFVMGI